MLNLKTISVITLSISLSALASHASAQTSSQELKTATVKSVEAEPKTMPRGMTVRKIKRVVKPLPTLTTATQPEQTYMSRAVINATSSDQKPQTRFIYNRSAVETQMPVYFSEDALKAK